MQVSISEMVMRSLSDHVLKTKVANYKPVIVVDGNTIKFPGNFNSEQGVDESYIRKEMGAYLNNCKIEVARGSVTNGHNLVYRAYESDGNSLVTIDHVYGDRPIHGSALKITIEKGILHDARNPYHSSALEIANRLMEKLTGIKPGDSK